MLLSAGGDIDAVESADFIAQEPKLRQLKSLNDERGGTLLSFFKLQDEDSQQNMSSAILGALFRNLMFHQPGQAVGSSITPAMQRLAKRRSEVYDGAAVVKAATDEIFKRYLDQMQVCDCPRLVAVMASLITEARGIAADGNDVRLIGTMYGHGHVHTIIHTIIHTTDRHDGFPRQRALLLTVKWNQPSFARRILVDLPPSHDHTRPMRKMLQHAIGQRRLEIVRLLLERPGAISLDDH